MNIENLTKTVSWNTHIHHVNNESALKNIMHHCIKNNKQLRVYGSGWSWSKFGITSDETIILGGDYGKIDYDPGNLTSITLGAGVKIHKFYEFIRDKKIDIFAKGGCLTTTDSQTVGGLIATNVHNSNIPSFYDVTKSITVATYDIDGNIIIKNINKFDDTDHFNSVIGGVGKTGIILYVEFYLSKKKYYTVQTTSSLLNPMSALKCTKILLKYHAMSKAPGDILCPVSQYGYVVVTEIKNIQNKNKNMIKLSLDRLDRLPEFLRNILLFIDKQIEKFVPSSLYFYVSYNFITTVILFGLDYLEKIINFIKYQDSELYYDLTAASSADVLMQDGHWEIEMYVNTKICKDVARIIDNLQFMNDYFLGLRIVNGCDALMAGNCGGKNETFVTINYDCFNRRQYDKFDTDCKKLTSILINKYPGEIRLHSGKWHNIPAKLREKGYPRQNVLKMKSLIKTYDPLNIFNKNVNNRDIL